MKRLIYLQILFVALFLTGCRGKNVQNISPASYIYNPAGKGPMIRIEFTRGRTFNYPIFAFWIEDKAGHFLQTLYVSESLGKGIFKHGDNSTGEWKPDEIRCPAALPFWSHHRGIKASDGLYIPDSKCPIPDAYTGPTPSGNFILTTNLDSVNIREFVIYFEVNQTWDWNEYWTNSMYPEDENYKTSCQPALVYKTEVNLDDPSAEYEMKVIGHSHYSGKTGKLNNDLSTITTALQIVQNIKVKVH